jgi:NADPH:quinone reductase-like Zn-dependent oxidoreductase
MKEVFPADFPEGHGSDLAGVISGVGEGVDDASVGDAVIGMSDSRNAQAQYALLPADHVTPMPEGLDRNVAGSLYVVGTTAEVMMRAARPAEGETVMVSGAAGGVGTLVLELPIKARFALERVADAYREVQNRHGLGKVVLEISTP